MNEAKRLGASDFNRYYRGRIIEITQYWDGGIENTIRYDVAEIEPPAEKLTFWGRGDGSLWTFQKTDLHDGAVIVADRGTSAKEVDSGVRTYICTVQIYYNSTLHLTPCREVLPPPTSTPAPTGTPMPTLVPTETPIPIPTDTPTRTPLPTATLIPTQTPVPTPTEIPTPTHTPIPTATATPMPTPTPIVSDLCAFHIQPESGISLRPFSRPQECAFFWQDEFNVFEIEVNVYDIASGSPFEKKVETWTQLYNRTAGTDTGGILNTQEMITYTIEEGSQHGLTYYEVIGRAAGNDSPVARFCATMFVSRFFELGDSDDGLIRISATICERDWNKSHYQQRITSVFDSFRPVSEGEQQ